MLVELAYQVGTRHFSVQVTEGGYDYSFYDAAFHLIDGGVLENPDITIEEAAEELLEEVCWSKERVWEDYDALMEQVEQADEVGALLRCRKK